MPKILSYKVFFALFSVVAAISCSEYDRVLKTDDANLKFEKAFKYYNKGLYVRASTLFEQLAPLTRGSRRADSVFFYQAMTQYKLNDYIIAGHFFNTFTTYFMNSKFLHEAAYMEAYCYYLQSPRPELDQTSTYQALDAFKLYMIRYPESPRIADCERILLELNEKLMEKSFLAAKMYYYIDDFKAAIVSFNECLLEFPDSKYREEIMFLLLKSKYELAVKSILAKQTERFQDTIDEYYSFITEFPQSKNKKDAETMYETAMRYVKNKNMDQELTNN